MREKVSYEPNVPSHITLEDLGKPCQGKGGPQRQYFLEENRITYLDEAVAALLDREEPQIGDTFAITRKVTSVNGRQKVSWEVTLIEEEPTTSTSAQAPPPPPLRSTRGNMATDENAAYVQRQSAPPPAVPLDSSPVTPASVRICAALMAAIDAATEARIYAASRKNIDLPFDFSDIRALANTMIINEKGGKQ